MVTIIYLYNGKKLHDYVLLQLLFNQMYSSYNINIFL